MKRRHFIILTAFLLLSQWGSIDHVYHAHKAGEVCDYCISGQSLDHAVGHSVKAVAVVKQTFVQPELTQASVSKSFTPTYAARAPPRFI